MKFWKSLRDQTKAWLDPKSLHFRMTLGIAILSALGLGAVATWMSIKMQSILITTHKQNLVYLGDRLPMDIEIYTDMYTLPIAAQKAIDHLKDNHTLLWVENPRGQIIAASTEIKAELIKLKNAHPLPTVQSLQGGYWVICANDLIIDGVREGRVYIAQNISEEQLMFLALLKNLTIATALGIIGMTLGIGIYIAHALKPLKALSEGTNQITIDHLHSHWLNLEEAPTEVQELAQTLESMLMRLSEAWEHQRQLISNVSHELRTPLTIVSGYLQSTLRRGTNLTASQKDALEIAHSETLRTIQLMQDLLDLARAESGRMHFQIEPVVANDLIEEVVAMARKYYQRQINLQIPAELIHLKIDRNRLQQVLLNLIDNGIKYSPVEQPVNVSLGLNENQVIIEVCDRGIGIPLAQQARIFERFYRVDEARSPQAGGTGLGLAIVKCFVDGMGGTIAVRSQPEQGSTFTLIFPRLEVSEIPPTLKLSPSS